MAPLTCYRHLFDLSTQLRLNSWMLMTGSIGMLASTLPVQMLLPAGGWRGLFIGVAALLVLAIVDCGVAPRAARPPPRSRRPLSRHHAPPDVPGPGTAGLFRLWRHDRHSVALGGAVVDAGRGRVGTEAAEGLFAVNLSMMCAFMAWGLVTAWPAVACRRHLSPGACR